MRVIDQITTEDLRRESYAVMGKIGKAKNAIDSIPIRRQQVITLVESALEAIRDFDGLYFILVFVLIDGCVRLFFNNNFLKNC
jgi:hypothetical protein